MTSLSLHFLFLNHYHPLATSAPEGVRTCHAGSFLDAQFPWFCTGMVQTSNPITSKRTDACDSPNAHFQNLFSQIKDKTDYFPDPLGSGLLGCKVFSLGLLHGWHWFSTYCHSSLAHLNISPHSPGCRFSASPSPTSSCISVQA